MHTNGFSPKQLLACAHKRVSVKKNSKLEEVIKYYSSIHIIFHSLPKYQERLQKLSFDYTTESFVKTNKYTYEVCSRYLIKLKNNSCSCWYFSKWGICKHAVAFSNVYGLSWFGDKYRIERSKFHTLFKKKVDLH